MNTMDAAAATDKGLFSHYNYLSTFNPYYCINGSGKLVFDTSFERILSAYTGEKEIDAASIACVLSKNFILGDRTLIKGIYRAPWMGKPNAADTGFDFAQVPMHGNRQVSQQELAETVFELLKEEIKEYIGNKKTVGILLSGGMDSRVVAGVIDDLIKNKEVQVDKVVAYTWGNDGSRDAVYAKEIAQRLGWEWRHYRIGADKMWRNMVMAGERGSEYSGIHLHAMPDVAHDAGNEVEVMLAGSYGDSVGRAEYSGKHVTRLQPIENHIDNFCNLITSPKYNESKGEWNKDVAAYHSLFPREKPYQQLELDYQLHYMRRMLNPCMEVINEKVPLFQAFTSPKVFGYMWSLDPSCRGNDFYKELFDGPLKSLSDIPWARTGLKYGQKEGTPDKYTKSHHSYSHIIQNELTGKMMESIQSSAFPSVNAGQLESLLKLTAKHQNHNFDYLESLTWGVSFGIFANKYAIKATGADGSVFENIINKGRLSFDYHITRKRRQLQKMLK